MSTSIQDTNLHVSPNDGALALILAGGKGSRLHELTRTNAKPVLEFGGKCKVIDFPLSNCVNSGIKKIGVLTHYQSASLIRHITNNWAFLDNDDDGFVEVLQSSQCSLTGTYEGTAHAIFQNIPFIIKNNPKYVAILAADHVYKMNYMHMLNCHINSGADMTVSCIEVPTKQAAGRFGVMQVDQHNRITSFAEKPAEPPALNDKPGYTLASMGNYIFNTAFLIEQLKLDAKKSTSTHDFGHDIIPAAIQLAKVNAYRYANADERSQPYWRDIGSIDAFWQTNMDVLGNKPKLDIEDSNWPILAKQIKAKLSAGKQRCGQQIINEYILSDRNVKTIISNTASINQSSLANDVSIGSDSIINQAVVLPGVTIGRNVVINKAIIDEGCDIPSGTMIGVDRERDLARGFRISSEGVVLVTQKMLLKSYKISNANLTNLSSTHKFVARLASE
jgi:glucose-1-phosphate adenylyltransferase